MRVTNRCSLAGVMVTWNLHGQPIALSRLVCSSSASHLEGEVTGPGVMARKMGNGPNPYVAWTGFSRILPSS